MIDAIMNILEEVRNEFVYNYGTGTNLCGYCIDASDRIMEKLRDLPISAREVEGYVYYDYYNFCSNVPYDPHTWVEAEINGVVYTLDVTGDQFNIGMERENTLPDIIFIKGLPHGYSYDINNDMEGEYNDESDNCSCDCHCGVSSIRSACVDS